MITRRAALDCPRPVDRRSAHSGRHRALVSGKGHQHQRRPPRPLVLDDAIAALLQNLPNPTFVTINYDDFWLKIPAHKSYCVICMKLRVERFLEVPTILKGVLRQREFSARRKRMGKLISVSGGSTRFYEVGRKRLDS